MKYFKFMMFAGIALLMSTAYADTNKAAAIPDYAADKLSNTVWVIHGPTELPNPKNQGFMNNPGIVLTSNGVVIVDPGSSLQTGEMVLRVLKTISDKPVVAVFNTHVHGDHWLGNQAMLAAYPKAKIYAHPEMITEAKAGAADEWIKLMQSMTKGATGGTVAVLPNTEVNAADIITIGDTHFRIYHNAQAHTRTDIMIEVVEQKLMFLGDNVTYKRIPRMVDGNFKGSFEAIDMALASKAKFWVPGHGPSGDVSVVHAYRDYLNGVYSAAKLAFDTNLDSSEVRAMAEKNTIAFKDWSGYKDEIGRHGVQAYAEIEAAEF
jgi:glyoxylase-like metal-dependent hydrolase (beta-lactamase superfamily II)